VQGRIVSTGRSQSNHSHRRYLTVLLLLLVCRGGFGFVCVFVVRDGSAGLALSESLGLQGGKDVLVVIVG